MAKRKKKDAACELIAYRFYGHDRGLVNLVTSCGDNGETVFQDGQGVRRIKERYARTRASLQAKGTKGARRVLKRIFGRENSLQGCHAQGRYPEGRSTVYQPEMSWMQGDR